MVYGRNMAVNYGRRGFYNIEHRWIFYFLGSGCSTEVEHKPCDIEDLGSNTSGYFPSLF